MSLNSKLRSGVRSWGLNGCLCVCSAIACVFLLFAGSAGAKVSETHPFEIKSGSFHAIPSTVQAGAHENLTTTLDFAHNNAGETFNDVRTTVLELPAGFTGNNTAVPTCTQAQLFTTLIDFRTSTTSTACPPASQVGIISLHLTDYATSGLPATLTQPLYNMEVTSFGVAAELGFDASGVLTQILTVSLRPGDSGLTVTSPDITTQFEPHEVSVTVWGVPASPEHDAERGFTCNTYVGANCGGGGEEANITAKPFLSMPTSCSGEPLQATLKADSWEHPEEWSEAKSEIAPIVECERVHFDPSIEVQPSTRAAESPTGLDVSLVVPQDWEKSETIATSNLKDAKVTLPEGFTINPSAGSGLGACTPQQYEAETASSLPGEGCPPESKIGSIEIETPVLAEKIPGAIYIAKPYENPFSEPGHPNGSLLALYVVAKDPARGIIIKVAGKLEPNPVTGQLVSTFLNNPQQPFTKFTLKFRPGATAPLVSPAACGTYTAQAQLTPWSAPLEPTLVTSSFETTQGVHEGPCPSGGIPPFNPHVISGTDNNDAGTYSPFYLRILREDGEQEITRFSTTLPPGLTGNLTGIPFCPEADIEASKNVSGAEEEANPSCPAASEIGHTIVEAGVGTVLAQTPGKIYLAGPYHGAPLSIVSITSAKVGPFDLGTVVIRFALDINPMTAQVEVSANGSDPIPHIIKGIVVHVRDIRVYMSHPNFILNPTNCTPQSISNTIDGAGANPANPADQVPVTVTSPFDAADCSSLKFQPTFKVSTSAKTSRADGASLTAKLTVSEPLGTQANISRVKVELPKALPSRLTTLQKACTAAQFEANPAGCPPASIIGHAKAITPILPVPLEGPAYFVSHGGEAFPDLEIVLQGYGFTIDLTATTFISKTGVTSSTFKTVPDQPVTSFELTLPEGPYSALTALGNLCAATNTVTVKKKVTVKVHGRKKTITRKVKQTRPATLQMPTEFVAQNGAEIHQDTPITVTGCPEAAHPKKAGKRRSKKAGKKK